jgi:hypothetical protein
VSQDHHRLTIEAGEAADQRAVIAECTVSV